MKIGVALSLYDKIDQLKTNVSIIRNHWNSHNDSFISVCCNNPELIKTIEDLEVNILRGICKQIIKFTEI